MEAKEWAVRIDLTEEGADTRAVAVLVTRDRTSLTGVGSARRNPIDRSVPEIGDELAAGRALADLAHKLLVVSSEDIAELAGQRPGLAEGSPP
ncbi:DUF1876 domain-containing protein [Nonomuraea roseoviolacea subsp. roseoviolacea]|uniref:DUF1876 domain-containing protein n=1 Tax=Nonomuraea roseoviolacea TaxID=103837 RepID=UPI0031D341C2